MNRRKFLSAIFIMPFVAKAIAENWAADENGNPIYMKDEYMMHHGEDLNLSGLEGSQDKNFIEHEVHPFGKVKFRADEIPDDWIPSRIEMNGHILERIYEYPKEKEVPKPLVTWQLFRKDGTIVTIK